MKVISILLRDAGEGAQSKLKPAARLYRPFAWNPNPAREPSFEDRLLVDLRARNWDKSADDTNVQDFAPAVSWRGRQDWALG